MGRCNFYVLMLGAWIVGCGSPRVGLPDPMLFFGVGMDPTAEAQTYVAGETARGAVIVREFHVPQGVVLLLSYPDGNRALRVYSTIGLVRFLGSSDELLIRDVRIHERGAPLSETEVWVATTRVRGEAPRDCVIPFLLDAQGYVHDFSIDLEGVPAEQTCLHANENRAVVSMQFVCRLNDDSLVGIDVRASTELRQRTFFVDPAERERLTSLLQGAREELAEAAGVAWEQSLCRAATYATLLGQCGALATAVAADESSALSWSSWQTRQTLLCRSTADR